MREPLPRQYFKTIFSSKENITHWPIHFAILKSNDMLFSDNTDGDLMTSCSRASMLKEKYGWAKHLSGINTDSGITDKYWAIAIGWSDACQLAQASGLETIFYVSDNTLSVTYCDGRRKPFYVDSFLRRFSVDMVQTD